MDVLKNVVVLLIKHLFYVVVDVVVVALKLMLHRTPDDSQRRFLAHYSVATLLRHCFEWLQHCCSVATLCCRRCCKSSDIDVQENGKKAIGLDWQGNNFARASRFFVHDFDVKRSKFMEEVREHKKTIFLDCKTVGFFLKISKEIGKAGRKNLTRANHASLTRSLSPVSLSVFSLLEYAKIRTDLQSTIFFLFL